MPTDIEDILEILGSIGNLMPAIHELAPCPFCGGIAVFRDECREDGSRNGVDYNYVQCTVCCCQTEVTRFMAYAELADIWNTRIVSDDPVKTDPEMKL